jgi:uncharacterized protein with PIN domain
MSAPPPRFLADAMVGKLARWLRILGYDTAYDVRWDDNELARMSRAQGRILLTRDVELSQRQGLRALLVHSQLLEEQLAQVVAECDLALDNPFTRCPNCNAPLEEAGRFEAQGSVPPYILSTQADYRFCPECDQFYWPGTHWQRMRRRIAALSCQGDEASS